MYKQLDKEHIKEIFCRFKKRDPEPKTELYAPNDFCLLVSVVLSAQTTDKAVNKATEPLYKVANAPESMVSLGIEGLMSYIKTIGLYRNKAKYIIELSKMLINDFNGQIPSNRENLMKLPGVGRKTANVILNVVYKQPTMPVDTHLLRIAPKIGLAPGKTPEQVESGLIKNIPSQFMNYAHHWLILHGRYTCKARKSDCQSCLIQDLCAHNTDKI
ncbi:MAG TPA: endonuclease III [Treponemataceae bacterium]|nr:endonuclease III [Treponemataceae bacterium]